MSMKKVVVKRPVYKPKVILAELRQAERRVGELADENKKIGERISKAEAGAEILLAVASAFLGALSPTISGAPQTRFGFETDPNKKTPKGPFDRVPSISERMVLELMLRIDDFRAKIAEPQPEMRRW